MYLLRSIEGAPGLPRALKAFNAKTVPELRQLCKDAGAPTTGAKATLVSCLWARVRSGGRGGVDAKTRALLDPSEAARALGASVARLAKMVDDDWFSSRPPRRPIAVSWTTRPSHRKRGVVVGRTTRRGRSSWSGRG